MPRNRPRLGELLVEAKLISAEQLATALESQRASRKRLGRVLMDAGLVSGSALTQVLSYQLCLPWVSLDASRLEPSLVSRFPADVATRHRLVPVYERGRGDNRTLYVATDDPTNDHGITVCSQHMGMPVRPVVSPPEEVSAALHELYGLAPTVFPAAAPNAGPPGPPPRRPPVRPGESASPMGSMRAVVDTSRSFPPSEPPPASLDGDAVELLPDEERSRVVVVGAEAPFIRACRDAAQAADSVVVTASLVDLATVLAEQAPIAVVVMEELYAFDRMKFTRLALEAGSPLVIWSQELEAHFLEPIFDTARRRAAS